MSLWSQLDSLIRELKRREVLRAAAVYAVSAWVAVQVATDVFPSLQLPSWMTTLVVVTAILCFPVVIVAAWVYEVTPQGIKRTPEAEGPPELVRARGTPWVAMLLVGVVTAASVGIGWAAWDLWLEPTGGVADADTPDTSEVPFSETRIAVLPFEHTDPDADLGWLAEGITKDLIDALDDIAVLDVVSYRGVMPYRGRVPPLDSVAQVHRTGNLVAGAVDEEGDRLVVRLELVDGESSSNLWSDRFVGGRDSVLALQERVLDAAVRQLRRRLGEEVQRSASRAAANDDEAWELVQRAERRMEEGTELRLTDQRELARRFYATTDSLYREAEDRDPGWVQPILGRGWLQLEAAHLPGEDRSAANPERLRRGIAHAERVLSSEPGHPAALELRGTLLHALSLVPSELDSAAELRERAREDLQAAVANDPERARAWAELSRVYQMEGRFDEAEAATVRARDADPFLTNELEYLMQATHMALETGEFEEAMTLAREGSERMPDAAVWDALRLLTLATTGAPRIPVDSVWQIANRMEELRGQRDPMARMQVAAALARLGHPDSARAVLDRSKENLPEELRAFATYYEANVWLQLGDRDRALELLSEYLKMYPGQGAYVSQDVWWGTLRPDSSFRALVSASR